MTTKNNKTGKNVLNLADTHRNDIMTDCERLNLPDGVDMHDYERKLTRARNISHFIHLHIRTIPPSKEPLLWLPEILSYISDDLDDVMNEIKDAAEGKKD
ncbi:hypothetical protein KU75_06465 [Pectobacterium odoriferum]|uniref:Uncharacterized protein n=1 Tax=Pectobacterium odoriferum TaxID=78398 RepID=A0ABR4VSJ6_9GAMM|nr:hypothetical protein [Pectobacterium odoriferum]KGA42348.1 hypothetical protein KU75_06465 [Pectobacterium odoriferum]